MFLEVIVRVMEPKETTRYFFVESDSTLHHKFISNSRGHYETTEFNTTYAMICGYNRK